MRRTDSLFLVGLKHVGKSTLARITARTLGMSTLDLDDLIVSINGRYRDARSIYRHCGKERFMLYETQAMEQALTRSHEEAFVVSTGGGIADNPAALGLLRSSQIPVLYLHEKPLVLYERAIAGGIPAFLDPERPREHFLELAESRDHIYRALADATVVLDGLHVEEAADQLIEEIRRKHAG